MRALLQQVALALALTAAGAAAAADAVSVGTVRQQLGKPGAPLLLDVRTVEEFAGGHVPGALNIPVQALAQRLAEVPKGRPVIVYCESGRRSARALDLLKEAGYTDVREMDGSMAAWREAGFAVEKR